jgi:hypothetical protein
MAFAHRVGGGALEFLLPRFLPFGRILDHLFLFFFTRLHVQ